MNHAFNSNVTFIVGDGKTHYIKKQLCRNSNALTIAVNEAFTPLKAIKKLQFFPMNTSNCGIFINFTMLPPGVIQNT